MGAALLAATLACLSACGDRPAGVPAVVNNTTISIPEVRAAMARTQSNDVGAVLDALIDEELLAQRALENKLDRRPDVVLALQAARRQILAAAAVRQRIGSISETDK